MLFNSSVFILLLTVTFFIFYIPRLAKYQLYILIASSLIFYSYQNPSLLLLLLFSAFINIFSSYKTVHGDPKFRKLYITSGVIINLLILGFFKYGSLVSTSLFPVNNSVGQFLLNIPLPIGISFYTFEGISLLVDVYSNRHKDYLTVDRSIKDHTLKTLFFISFFPHLVSGPILKAYEFYPQIKTKYFKDIKWESVVKNLILGYFLKTVVADNLNAFTYWMYFPFFKGLSSANLVALMLSYSFQIFADFAGYSLIAIGLAKLFCYDLMTNFLFPYISVTFSEFWRRWHISLSTFLKEYLYIPLGGNRKGNVRTYVNLFITMLLGGLWHGSAWSYLVWGAFHGLLLAFERLITQVVKFDFDNFIIKLIKGLIVFSLVTVGWLLFKLPQFSYVIEYFKSIQSNTKVGLETRTIPSLLIFSSFVVFYHLIYIVKPKCEAFFVKYQFIVYSLLLFMIIVNRGPSGSFIYFQF